MTETITETTTPETAAHGADQETLVSYPVPNRAKAAAFTALVVVCVFINTVCGVLNYTIHTRGAILEDLYDELVSRQIEIVVWVTAGIGLLGALSSLVAYVLSFDYRRMGRPVVRLWILLTSFFVFVAGTLLGLADVDPDAVPIILGAVLVCFVMPLPVLLLERATGRGALRSAKKLMDGKHPGSSRASARTGLTFLPGNKDAIATYGLALSAADKHLQALPYLHYTEQHEDPLAPATISALADSWEAAGHNEKTINYLDQLPAEYDSADMLDRKVRLWLEAGQSDRALESMREMSVPARRPWRAEYRELLIKKRDRKALHTLCFEIHADEGAPFEDTVSCLKQILTLYPSDTKALIALIDLQKELKEHNTVAALQEELLTIEEDRIDVRRELVNYYWERGNRSELVRHLNRILLAGQANTEEKLRLLEETYTEGDYFTVEQMVAREDDLTNNARALAILANALHQGGRDEEALERISQARRLGGDDRLNQNLDALSAKIKKNVLDRELTDYEQRAATSPADLDLKFEYLDRLVAARMAERVVVQLDDLLRAQPDLYERVEKEIRVMLSRHGKNRRLMDYLGDLYLRQQEYDKAYDLFDRRAQGEMDSTEILHDAVQRILDRNPQHAPSLLSEFYYYHGTGDYASALAAFDAYKQTGVGIEKDVLLTEMDAAEKAGKHSRALETGEELLAADADNTELLSHVGRLARGAEDFPRAIEHIKRAAELDPDSFEYRRQLREAVETSKKTRMAEIKEQLAKTPGDRILLEELGDLYHDFDQLNEAIASYQKAGRNNPEQRIPRAKQGYVLARKGLFTDADEVLQEAELRPDLDEDEQEKLKNLFFITAQLMEEEEERLRALALYRRIFRVDAGYRNVVEHIERLQVSSKKKEKKY